MTEQAVIDAMRHWVQSVVIDLNLCPFAKREFDSGRVHFAVSEATTEGQLLDALKAELDRLDAQPGIETTLLIHPYVLQDFFDFNEFLGYAEHLLVQLGLEGIYQIASFHPDYRFADTPDEDAGNYTNRSPYPVLHLIREASLEAALASYPDPDQIPERNIARLEALGIERMRALLSACLR